MNRYLTPILFFAATGFVFWYNAGHADSKVVVPFIEVLVPSTAGDPAAMGQASGFVFLGLSVLLTALAVLRHARDIASARAVDDDD